MSTSLSRVHIGNARGAFDDILGRDLARSATVLPDMELRDRAPLALRMSPICDIADLNARDWFRNPGRLPRPRQGARCYVGGRYRGKTAALRGRRGQAVHV